MNNPLVDLLFALFELVTGLEYAYTDQGRRLIVAHPHRMVLSGLVTFALALWILVLV